MNIPTLSKEAQIIVTAARRFASAADYDALVDRAKDAQLVLIGEATHGTHEFYAIRAALTRRLVEQHGFRIIALEADWPDMLQVHRYVTGQPGHTTAAEALATFRRFPAWMWRNTVMLDFVEWLRQWNLRQGAEEGHAGLYGMDLYSMHTSMDSVLSYLDKTDPAAAMRARRRYGCFETFGDDPQEYGYATTRGTAEPCADEVAAQLAELRRKYGAEAASENAQAGHELFYAEQNARLVANAERYYRTLFYGGDESWNLRDTHMTDTLAALIQHFGAAQSKVVVWAHNSHLGDARATDVGERGQVNVGQLARERFGAAQVYSIGFTTYSGWVTAARDWGGKAERRQVVPGIGDSYEELFHTTALPSFWLDLQARNAATELLHTPRLQRAIGVIYRPETERWSHYFHVCLPRQFDAVIHIDKTHALRPLERHSTWDPDELPETYPVGL